MPSTGSVTHCTMLAPAATRRQRPTPGGEWTYSTHTKSPLSPSPTERTSVSTGSRGLRSALETPWENNGTTNPLCAVISEMREGQPMDIPCNMEGHYVTIVLPGREKYLALCEVEVYGGK
uniref:Fucolectin tachylectin-4 pentraxin-1 domain-containing protein n=1 Tax=Hucho hucho TaxID=62062 RepID=A0A4W5QAY6_9TELE